MRHHRVTEYCSSSQGFLRITYISRIFAHYIYQNFDHDFRGQKRKSLDVETIVMAADIFPRRSNHFPNSIWMHFVGIWSWVKSPLGRVLNKELECCFFISFLSNIPWYSGSGNEFFLVKVCHLEGQLKIAIRVSSKGNSWH